MNKEINLMNAQLAETEKVYEQYKERVRYNEMYNEITDALLHRIKVLDRIQFYLKCFWIGFVIGVLSKLLMIYVF